MRCSRTEKGDPASRASPTPGGCSASRDWLGTDAKVVRHVRVCGDGHLAVATRIELERLGIHRDTDYLLPSLRPALVIACADSETDQSFHDAAQQAANEGSPLLFGCLLGRVLRLGPLIEPCECFVPMTSAAQPSDPSHPLPFEAIRVGEAHVNEDRPLSLYARLGALLISAQTLNFLLGARNQCVRDRTVEFNPWSMESKGYSVFKVRQ
jgi:hypothetical protein